MGPNCFSLTASRNGYQKSVFKKSGLRPITTDLGDGTVMHCWVPKNQSPSKPNLLLLHGFGANATWQWDKTLRRTSSRFNVYVPDLIFFGASVTTRSERSEAFQARCVMRAIEACGVRRVKAVVGVSYGGFVAYSLASQFREAVERVVICCAGVCLEERDLRVGGMFKADDVEGAARILLPQTAEKLRELTIYTFFKPPRCLPSCLLHDFIRAMCREYVKEKTELLAAIAKNRKLSDIPKITQPTLIIWGDHDQVFPLELGQRLKWHIGEKAELVVIKNAGHAFIVENFKEFYNNLMQFIVS